MLDKRLNAICIFANIRYFCASPTPHPLHNSAADPIILRLFCSRGVGGGGGAGEGDHHQLAFSQVSQGRLARIVVWTVALENVK